MALPLGNTTTRLSNIALSFLMLFGISRAALGQVTPPPNVDNFTKSLDPAIAYKHFQTDDARTAFGAIMAEAHLRLAERNWDQAIERCDAALAALAVKPLGQRRIAVALMNRAIAYDGKGNIRHALNDYTEAIREDPTNPYAHGLLGLLSIRLIQLAP